MKKITFSLPLVGFVALLFLPSLTLLAADDTPGEGKTVVLDESSDISPHPGESPPAKLDAAPMETAPLMDLSRLNAEIEFLRTPSENQFPEPPCNQGAWCNYPDDSPCGPEGYCDQFSNCCMCY